MNKKSEKLLSVLENNVFMLRLVLKYSPQLIISGSVFTIIHSISWFVEHIWGFQKIMEAIELGDSFRVVLLWVLVIWGFTLLQHCFNAFYKKYITPKYTAILKSKIKELFCRKAWELDLLNYDDTAYYNEFIWSIEEAPTRAIKAVTLFQNFIGNVLTIILSGVFLLSYDRVGLLFVVISFVGNYFLSSLINKVRFPYLREIKFKEREREYFKRTFYLNDYAKELRLNRIFPKLMSGFINSNRAVEQTIDHKSKTIFALEFIKTYFFNSFLFNCAYIFYLSVNIIILKNIPISSFLSLYRSSTNTKSTLLNFSSNIADFHENSMHIEKLRKFLASKPKLTSPEKYVKTPREVELIEFRNVCFRYENSQENIINNVSFQIRAGEHIAFVGYNGAGKTTLVKLLMRLYDVTSGEILLNGINIKQYKLDEYRNLLSVVFQNFQIFAVSLEDNIKMGGTRDYNKESILKSLELAGFKDRLLRLPNGLKTVLSSEFCDEGVELSGGERQKIALARIFYRDSSLIILDEPSSSLDPISEYNFYKSIGEIARDKTLITISHRLSSTRASDKIFVMDKGMIIESGSHDQLMQNNGVYADMFRLQSNFYSTLNIERN